MLKALAEHIRACEERAAECREKANDTGDAAVKAEYMEMEVRWKQLAQSYQLVESLERFLLDSQKGKNATPQS